MLRATLESTTDGILVTNSRDEVTGYNERFVAMWRLPDGPMESGEHRRLLELTSQRFDDAQQYLARIDDIYESSTEESHDLLELADGSFFERFSRIQFVAGENVGRVWSYRDITERRRAEDALEKQAEWSRVTLASIGDGVITTDAAGRVSFLNGVAEKLTGWTLVDATGRPLPEVFCIVNEFTRPAGGEPRSACLAPGNGRRTGEPHDSHRPGRQRTSRRR